MKKYFIVTAKCGHVGRDNYIPIDYPVCAQSAKEAAAIARKLPGVKHHHPDAILSVKEVCRKKYKWAWRVASRDIYWQKGHLGTRNNLALLFPRIVPENPYHTVHKLAVSQRMVSKSDKIDSRRFRFHKARQYEESMRDDIEKEFGIVV